MSEDRRISLLKEFRNPPPKVTGREIVTVNPTPKISEAEWAPIVWYTAVCKDGSRFRFPSHPPQTTKELYELAQEHLTTVPWEWILWEKSTPSIT